VKLKVHHGFVLSTSCVPETVGINKNDKKIKNDIPIRKKGQNCKTSDLRGLKLGGGVHWTGH